MIRQRINHHEIDIFLISWPPSLTENSIDHATLHIVASSFIGRGFPELIRNDSLPNARSKHELHSDQPSPCCMPLIRLESIWLGISQSRKKRRLPALTQNESSETLNPCSSVWRSASKERLLVSNYPGIQRKVGLSRERRSTFDERNKRRSSP